MDKYIELCSEMYSITRGICEKRCKKRGACCDRFFCEDAWTRANEAGTILPWHDGQPLPLLVDGECAAPPQFRPICTVHQCDIASLGYFKDSPMELTDRYYDIRDEIDSIMLEKGNK